MKHKNIECLKYPIGEFSRPTTIDNTIIKKWITVIEDFPLRIKEETENLTLQELDKKYRPDGWPIKQVVHHCADSHLNSFIRFKLTLTENTPTIKPYLESLWAELPDSKDFPIESSIKILEGVHQRWVALLKSLNMQDLNRRFEHPETQEFIDLKTNIGIYAWHCEHHLAHIVQAKKN